MNSIKIEVNVEAFRNFAINCVSDEHENRAVALNTDKSGRSVLVGRDVKVLDGESNRRIRDCFVAALKGDARFKSLGFRIDGLLLSDKAELPLTARVIKDTLSKLARHQKEDFADLVADTRMMSKATVEGFKSKTVNAETSLKGADEWVEIDKTPLFSARDVTLLKDVVSNDAKEAFKEAYGRALGTQADSDYAVLDAMRNDFRMQLDEAKRQMAVVDELKTILTNVKDHDDFSTKLDGMLAKPDAASIFGKVPAPDSVQRKCLSVALNCFRSASSGVLKNVRNRSAVVQARTLYADFQTALLQADRWSQAFANLQEKIRAHVESEVSEKGLPREQAAKLKAFAEGLVEKRLEGFAHLLDAGDAENYCDDSDDATPLKDIKSSIGVAANRLSKTDEEIVKDFKGRLVKMLNGAEGRLGLVEEYKETLRRQFGEDVNMGYHFDLNEDGVATLVEDMLKDACNSLRDNLQRNQTLAVADAEKGILETVQGQFKVMRGTAENCAECLKYKQGETLKSLRESLSETLKRLDLTDKDRKDLLTSFMQDLTASAPVRDLVGKAVCGLLCEPQNSDRFKGETVTAFCKGLKDQFEKVQSGIRDNQAKLEKELMMAEGKFLESLASSGLGEDARADGWKAEVRGLIKELLMSEQKENVRAPSGYDLAQRKETVLAKLNDKITRITESQTRALQDAQAKIQEKPKEVKVTEGVTWEEKIESFRKLKADLKDVLHGMAHFDWPSEKSVDPYLSKDVYDKVEEEMGKLLDKYEAEIQNEKPKKEGQKLAAFDRGATVAQLKDFGEKFFGACVEKVGLFVKTLDDELKNRGLAKAVNLTGAFEGAREDVDDASHCGHLRSQMLRAAQGCIRKGILDPLSRGKSPDAKLLAETLLKTDNFLEKTIETDTQKRKGLIALVINTMTGDTNHTQGVDAGLCRKVLTAEASRRFPEDDHDTSLRAIAEQLVNFTGTIPQTINRYRECLQKKVEALLKENGLVIPEGREGVDIDNAIATRVNIIKNAEDKDVLEAFQKCFLIPEDAETNETVDHDADMIVAGLKALVEVSFVSDKDISVVIDGMSQKDWMTGDFLANLSSRTTKNGLNESELDEASTAFKSLPAFAKKAFVERLAADVKMRYLKAAADDPESKESLADLAAIKQKVELRNARTIKRLNAVMKACRAVLVKNGVIGKKVSLADFLQDEKNEAYANQVKLELNRLMMNPTDYARAHIGYITDDTTKEFVNAVKELAQAK